METQAEIENQAKEDFDKTISMIANCVGYEMFKDVKETTITDDVPSIWLEEDDIARVYMCARRILKEMIISGWTKVPFVGEHSEWNRPVDIDDNQGTEQAN